jgi:hypothetical protein
MLARCEGAIAVPNVANQSINHSMDNNCLLHISVVFLKGQCHEIFDPQFFSSKFVFRGVGIRSCGVNETAGSDLDIFVKGSTVSMREGNRIQWCLRTTGSDPAVAMRLRDRIRAVSMRHLGIIHEDD